jgi:hypothetical protein
VAQPPQIVASTSIEAIAATKNLALINFSFFKNLLTGVFAWLMIR